jgi:DNA end-binding protein Ku
VARAIWTGSISFGLVTVPVGLYSATEDHTIHFHQFERGTTDRVRNKRVNERTDDEVDYSDVVKGRESANGKVVLIEPAELADVAPGRSRTIDITGFVDLSEIDPIYFQKTYYLAPQGDEHQRPYALLLQALERSERAGIAMFVMRGKEYLTAIRPQRSVLTLQTMFFADEVRDPRKELDRIPRKSRFSGKEVDIAVQLIESLSIPWKPRDYKDTYTRKVDKLVKAKRGGKEVAKADEPAGATNVTDLMDALQRSVEQQRKPKKRKKSNAGKGKKAAS